MQEKNIQIREVIWDVSGTLWSDIEQVIYANLKVLYDNGILTVPRCRKEEEAGRKLDYSWIKNNLLGSAVEQFRSFGLTGDDHYLEGLYKKALKFTSEEHPVYLFGGISNLLARLSENGISQGVISSHPLNHLHNDFERLGIFDHFEYIEGSVHDKSDSILKVAWRNSRLEDYGIVYVGDTMSDMVAANKAGVISLGVDWGYQNREKIQGGNPKKLFSSVSELSDYLL
ncbi:MAG: HAD family hydrolase [Nanoarchaeota archaeon]|nr:HAD family hydrolase [Nanoarchaeota archaeon]MCA9495991.1 HAD family hydrolase [Nanoarchaeota archaeon]